MCWGEGVVGLWESDKEWSWQLKPFSKLKTTFCLHWTSNWVSPSRENPVIPYIKAKKKNYFYYLKNYFYQTKQPSKYLSCKHRVKFLLFEYLDKKMYTAWKVSKYGDFSGPSGPIFLPQSEYGKIPSRKNSVFRHFSRSGI